jgi:hypothetical protein
MKSRAVGAVPVALVTRWLRREEETAPWPTTGAVNWSGVVAFVLLAFGLGWAAWIGLRGLCPLALRTYIAAFAPMFAAIAVLRVQRRGSLRRDRRVGLKRVIESIPESILLAGVTGYFSNSLPCLGATLGSAPQSQSVVATGSQRTQRAPHSARPFARARRAANRAEALIGRRPPG